MEEIHEVHPEVLEVADQQICLKDLVHHIKAAQCKKVKNLQYGTEEMKQTKLENVEVRSLS